MQPGSPCSQAARQPEVILLGTDSDVTGCLTWRGLEVDTQLRDSRLEQAALHALRPRVRSRVSAAMGEADR